MDTETLKKQGLTEMQEIIARLGGWPVVQGEEWKGEKNFKWYELVIKAAREGGLASRPFPLTKNAGDIIQIGKVIITSYFQNIWVLRIWSIYLLIEGYINDNVNTSKLLITFSEFQQPGLKDILKKGFDDPLTGTQVQNYYQERVKMAVQFGAIKQRAEEEMKAAVQLEINLANFTLPLNQKRNASAVYNPMPLSEVQKLFPQVPLIQYIKAILGVEVTEEEVVNVESPGYITEDIYLWSYI